MRSLKSQLKFEPCLNYLDRFVKLFKVILEHTGNTLQVRKSKHQCPDRFDFPEIHSGVPCVAILTNELIDLLRSRKATRCGSNETSYPWLKVLRGGFEQHDDLNCSTRRKVKRCLRLTRSVSALRLIRPVGQRLSVSDRLAY